MACVDDIASECPRLTDGGSNIQVAQIIFFGIYSGSSVYPLTAVLPLVSHICIAATDRFDSGIQQNCSVHAGNRARPLHQDEAGSCVGISSAAHVEANTLDIRSQALQRLRCDAVCVRFNIPLFEPVRPMAPNESAWRRGCIDCALVDLCAPSPCLSLTRAVLAGSGRSGACCTAWASPSR